LKINILDDINTSILEFLEDANKNININPLNYVSEVIFEDFLEKF
jgi:hypothetical protein